MRALVISLIVFGLAPPPIQRPSNTKPPEDTSEVSDAVAPNEAQAPPAPSPENAPPETPPPASTPANAPSDSKQQPTFTVTETGSADESTPPEGDYAELPRYDEVEASDIEVLADPEADEEPDAEELVRQWEKQNQPDRYRDAAIGTGAVSVILSGGAIIVATTAPCGQDGSTGGTCAEDPRVQASIATGVLGGIGVLTAIALGIAARRQKLRSKDTARVTPILGPTSIGLRGRF